MGPIFLALVFIHLVVAGATPTETSILHEASSARSVTLIINAVIWIVIIAVVVGVVALAVIGLLALFAPGLLGSLTGDLRRMAADEEEELNNLADKVLKGQQFLERLTAQINSLNGSKTPKMVRRPKSGKNGGNFVYHEA